MRALVLCVLIFSVLSCARTTKRGEHEETIEYLKESKLSFHDPYELSYTEGKYQGYVFEKWIREPENLWSVHETFKKIGYHKLVSKEQLYADETVLWGYVAKPLHVLIDSLIITYPLVNIESTYYREFWQRRKVENNDSAVYKILTEVADILLQEHEASFNSSLVNDTLFTLVRIKNSPSKPSHEQAIQDFVYLRDMGLHLSAYNLLYETYSYQDVLWNKDSLARTLEKGNIECCPDPWIVDTTK